MSTLFAPNIQIKNKKGIQMSNQLIFILTFSGTWGIVGIIFWIIGIIILNNRKKKELRCTSKTYGKVTDIVRHQSYDSDNGYSSSWYPIFEYTIGELKFIKESPYGSSHSKYAIGQTVEIYYNPKNYHEYYIPSDTLSKTLATIFTIVGIVAILLAIIPTLFI